MDLSNEDAEKALLIQLADRNIISDELVQRVFGFDPDMEKSRLNRENRERKSQRMVNKAGPWYDPQFENSLRKISLQTGLATPSQVGLVLDKKKNGEKTILEMKTPTSPLVNTNNTNKGIPEQGRPKNSTDTQKRKQKVFKPQTGASLQVWTMNAQDKISEILNPYLLDFYQKKNMRSLSKLEYDEAEQIKLKIFLSLDPFTEIKHDLVLGKLNTVNNIDVVQKYNLYSKLMKNVSSDLNRPLTSEEIKHTKSYAYSELVYDN